MCPICIFRGHLETYVDVEIGDPTFVTSAYCFVVSLNYVVSLKKIVTKNSVEKIPWESELSELSYERGQFRKLGPTSLFS